MSKKAALSLIVILCLPNSAMSNPRKKTPTPITHQQQTQPNQKVRLLLESYKRTNNKIARKKKRRKYQRRLKIILSAIVSIVGSAFLCYIATLRVIYGIPR